MATLVQAAQRTPEWYAARLGRATASKFSDVMAKTRSGYSATRSNYRAELVAEILTGQQADQFTTAAMQWGIDNEPVARLQYELLTGNEVTETGFWLHDDLEAGASPDGFIGADGLIEIKCPNTATHLDTLVRRKIPRQYEAQVQGQMWVTGRQWCDFVSYDPRLPDNAQIFIVRIPRDALFIEELEAEVRGFTEEVKDLVEFVRNFK
jgi:putative phage-type endonuclease